MTSWSQGNSFTVALGLPFGRNIKYLNQNFSIFFSQDNTRQLSSHHDVAMDLINSVTGVDEEGRSRQRILSFAAKRFFLLCLMKLCSFVLQLDYNF
jgi:hypothetical protein